MLINYQKIRSLDSFSLMSLSLLTGLGQMGVGGGGGMVLTLSLSDCLIEFCKVTLTLRLEPNPMM